jgi:histidine triad (HIT) family protein
MTLDADCIFCKIIKGEIPSFNILEDGSTLAFMDINPGNTGHALVIPKYHTPDFLEAPEEWLSATMVTAQKVARAVKETLGPHGINIVVAHGTGAAQSVFHLHVHVLPRAEGDDLRLNWGLVPGDMDAIGELAERIKANMGAL